MSVREHPAALRLALSPAEAAASLGISRDYFDEHVLPSIRVVREGRRIIVPVREIEAWLEENAARLLNERPARMLAGHA